MHHVVHKAGNGSRSFPSAIHGGSSIAVMPDSLQYFLGPRSFHDS